MYAEVYFVLWFYAEELLLRYHLIWFKVNRFFNEMDVD